MHKTFSRPSVVIFLFMTFIFFSPQFSCATEEYAKQTGQACSACHLDSSGGGELTASGKTFAATLHKTENPATGILSKGIRLVVGYIHFLTAIFWFGTILYVHLVLKPAYAASGLPRGELRVGITSMAIMGITGLVLTFYRVNSLDTLIHSRFGILLLAKISLYLVMVISVVIVITVIGPRLKARRKKPLTVVSSGDLSPEDLTSCDGKDGRPAYFAYEGKIYDATMSRLWQNGIHMKRHNAGNDLTEDLKLAPHGEEKVAAMREVGNFVANAPQKRELHEQVFFFMAHMNLVIVLIIILILSLWRWW